MVVLRATQKVMRRLPPSSLEPGVSDTALGDWYVNRIVVDRQPLLLLVSSSSLLTLLAPARAVRELPSRLGTMVSQRLQRLGIPTELIEAELTAMSPVLVGSTRDRSVLGSMIDFAKHIPFYLDSGSWDTTTLPFVEARLAETPCRVTGRFEDTIFPDRVAPQLIRERWASRRFGSS